MQKEGLMTRRRFAAVAGTGIAAAAQSFAQAKRPNVLLILADDLGARDTGFQGGAIPTPHLDRIAREGVRFDQFCCFPLCTPSRAALMTGRNPGRYGLI